MADSNISYQQSYKNSKKQYVLLSLSCFVSIKISVLKERMQGEGNCNKQNSTRRSLPESTNIIAISLNGRATEWSGANKVGCIFLCKLM